MKIRVGRTKSGRWWTRVTPLLSMSWYAAWEKLLLGRLPLRHATPPTPLHTTASPSPPGHSVTQPTGHPATPLPCHHACPPLNHPATHQPHQPRQPFTLSLRQPPPPLPPSRLTAPHHRTTPPPHQQANPPLHHSRHTTTLPSHHPTTPLARCPIISAPCHPPLLELTRPVFTNTCHDPLYPAPCKRLTTGPASRVSL